MVVDFARLLIIVFFHPGLAGHDRFIPTWSGDVLGPGSFVTTRSLESPIKGGDGLLGASLKTLRVRAREKAIDAGQVPGAIRAAGL
jgi:hypothetical protein